MQLHEGICGGDSEDDLEDICKDPFGDDEDDEDDKDDEDDENEDDEEEGLSLFGKEEGDGELDYEDMAMEALLEAELLDPNSILDIDDDFDDDEQLQKLSKTKKKREGGGKGEGPPPKKRKK
uniref:Uncharacterized protein n=1 Tax=Paramoeba aestuarina TaxID=180227 RepID=A0A7S4NE11_9EUKA|mmetsp:Transcript_14672/g.22902  ORF Transcript_14672/g.22902 Transcript_14672/m.22902 type:complete len:122 (+) Transcript_14672:114-479(+)